MLLAIIDVFRTNATAIEVAPIVAGLVGATVNVRFDPGWDDYEKVFMWSGSGQCIKDEGATGVIPHEVVEEEGSVLKFGVYGTKGGIEIPTIWLNLGLIQPSADPSDGTDDPTGDSIIVDEDGYLTTASGGFEVDEDGNLIL